MFKKILSTLLPRAAALRELRVVFTAPPDLTLGAFDTLGGDGGLAAFAMDLNAARPPGLAAVTVGLPPAMVWDKAGGGGLRGGGGSVYDWGVFHGLTWGACARLMQQLPWLTVCEEEPP